MHIEIKPNLKYHFIVFLLSIRKWILILLGIIFPLFIFAAYDGDNKNGRYWGVVNYYLIMLIIYGLCLLFITWKYRKEILIIDVQEDRVRTKYGSYIREVMYEDIKIINFTKSIIRFKL